MKKKIPQINYADPVGDAGLEERRKVIVFIRKPQTPRMGLLIFY